MHASKLTRRLFCAAEIMLLVGTIAAAAWLSRSEEWHPLALVVVLSVLALLGQRFTVKTSAGVLSASLVTIVLAMSLLGPVPAAVFGIVAMILNSAVRRLTPTQWLNNISAFAAVPFAGGLMVRALAGDVHQMPSHDLTQGVTFGLVVLGVFVVAVGLNFILIGLDTQIEQGYPLARQVREVFLPLLPGQLAAGMIATILAISYRSIGLTALFGAIAVLLILQHLTVALLRSEERAEQLQARSLQLSSFQWGVPSMFMQGLGLRDPTALRHAAAVASYAKAIAIELERNEDEQELIHLAGLLHDIGKFTWSDRILHPENLTDADWVVIRRHPQDGASMVGMLDGFGDVADAILYHHERVDGGGYPAGLIGKEIPLASRIVAICTTYDTMTKRETFGPPMSSEEAIAELRTVAGGQLDAELVETFITLLEREGPTFGQKADYKTELAFERRVRKMAQPGKVAAPARSPLSDRARSRSRAWRSSVRGLRERTLSKG